MSIQLQGLWRLFLFFKKVYLIVLIIYFCHLGSTKNPLYNYFFKKFSIIIIIIIIILTVIRKSDTKILHSNVQTKTIFRTSQQSTNLVHRIPWNHFSENSLNTILEFIQKVTHKYLEYHIHAVTFLWPIGPTPQ